MPIRAIVEAKAAISSLQDPGFEPKILFLSKDLDFELGVKCPAAKLLENGDGGKAFRIVVQRRARAAISDQVSIGTAQTRDDGVDLELLGGPATNVGGFGDDRREPTVAETSAIVDTPAQAPEAKKSRRGGRSAKAAMAPKSSRTRKGIKTEEAVAPVLSVPPEQRPTIPDAGEGASSFTRTCDIQIERALQLRM